MLFVEDDPRDVKLTTQILKKAGYRLALDEVDRPALLRERLELGDYDIVICDFNLKGWTAIDALEIVKE